LNAGLVARLLLLLIAVTLATVAFGAPRFTWANEGVVIDHPPAQPLAALAAALALVAAAIGSRRRALLAGAAIAAAGLTTLAVLLFAFRVSALESGVDQRSLGRAVHIRWSDVAAVEPRADHVTLRARDGTTLVIATARFQPDERVRLERTIARRVREAAQ